MRELPKEPEFHALVKAPWEISLSWIKDFFELNTAAIVNAGHIVTGREFYSGDTTNYAVSLAAEGYKEADRYGKELAETRSYDSMDTEQLLQVVCKLLESHD